MLLSPSLWPQGRFSYMARRLGLCSQVVSLGSDWTGKNSGDRERGSANGGVPGAQRCAWVRRPFTECHGRPVAHRLFLPLRDWQLGAHGAGAVCGRRQLREAGELGDQPQSWGDRGRDWEERKRWVNTFLICVRHIWVEMCQGSVHIVPNRIGSMMEVLSLSLSLSLSLFTSTLLRSSVPDPPLRTLISLLWPPLVFPLLS